MLGCLPSVTPPNWCSITTGCWPRTHGITCYTNQTLGSALNLEEANWDNSNVTADFIWQAFEKEGKRSIALNYCEAWPPRNKENDLTVLIDGGISAFLSAKMAPFLMKFGGIGFFLAVAVVMMILTNLLNNVAVMVAVSSMVASMFLNGLIDETTMYAACMLVAVVGDIGVLHLGSSATSAMYFGQPIISAKTDYTASITAVIYCLILVIAVLTPLSQIFY